MDERTHPPLTPALLAAMRTAWRDMPALRLNLAGAMAFWGLDAVTCDVALRILAEEGVLNRDADGRVHLRESSSVGARHCRTLSTPAPGRARSGRHSGRTLAEWIADRSGARETVAHG